MINDKKYITVGICSIGSGVGQSVINSCRLSGLPMRTIGLGTNPMANGLYDCNSYLYTPSYYDSGYVDSLLSICVKEQIDVLIPGHDDEAHKLARHVSEFESAGTRVIVSGSDLLDICRKKEKMCEALNPIAGVFVRSFTRDNFLSAWKRGDVELPVIAKPGDGYASKGIEIILREEDFSSITDGHIVQELAIPHNEDPNRDFCLNQISKGLNPQVAEISIQIVFGINGEVMGRMASYNKLNNGVPIEILPFDSDEMWNSIEPLIPKLLELGARGPVNLQGRMTNQGLKIFEINARFTGITGLRAVMGFNEVEACIKHWMTGEPINLRINQNRVGIRQTADKVVNLDRNEEVLKAVKSLNHGILKQKKTILVTGSTGSIGRRITKVLAGKNEFELLTLDRDKKKAVELHQNSSVKSFEWSDLLNGKFALGNVDCLLHLASARPHHGEVEIAKGIEKTFKLFTNAAQSGISEIINISSQSVYGHSFDVPWHEEQDPAPETPYGQSKYAAEVMLSNLSKLYPGLRHTSIRLATVTGKDPEIAEYEAISKILKRLKSENSVKIYGGEQMMERIDILDVTEAMVKLLESDSEQWKPIYNLGTGKCETLANILAVFCSKIEAQQPGVRGLIEVLPASEKHQTQFLLDVSQFERDFQWQAKRSWGDLL